MHGERVSANNEKPRILGHESRQDIVKIVVDQFRHVSAARGAW